MELYGVGEGFSQTKMEATVGTDTRLDVGNSLGTDWFLTWDDE